MFIFGELFLTICFSYSGIFEINCSKDIKVQGIIGPCASLEKVSLNGLTVFLFP